jgi:peptidoglycan/xylan/chitin deacetylase (PgdA/CDA1 family)
MLLLFVAIGAGIVFLAHAAPFPFLLDRLASRQALWRAPVRTGPPAVYLTFDDGPNPTATPALLDVLAREDVRATFFLLDHHINDETAGIVRRIVNDGHAVALHSHTRRLMLGPPEAVVSRLQAAADRVERITGRPPIPAFRPHAGWRSGAMYEALDRLGYRLVGWGWGLWDWNWSRPRSAGPIVERIVPRVSNGDIIVMHDGHHEDPRADRRYAVEATMSLIPALRARGFRFATIADAL